MWNDRQSMGLGQGCHLPALGDTTRPDDIRLDDVDRPPLDQLAKSGESGFRLVASDRDVKLLGEMSAAGEILRRDWFLQPEDIERLDGAHEAKRDRGRPGVVGINGELDAWPERLASGADPLDVLLQRDGRIRVPGHVRQWVEQDLRVAPHLDFDVAEAARCIARDLVRELDPRVLNEGDLSRRIKGVAVFAQGVPGGLRVLTEGRLVVVPGDRHDVVMAACLAALRYERAALQHGQWWRLISAHLVHLDVRHLLLDSAGLVLLWALYARELRPWQWLAALCGAIAAIESLTKQPEVGDQYTGKVVKTTDFGAFVELKKGTDGLLHVSNVGPGRVAHIEDVIARGDVLDVLVQEVDKARGRIGLKLVAKHENGNKVQPEELIERLGLQRCQRQLAADVDLAGAVLGEAHQRSLAVPVEQLVGVDQPGRENRGLGPDEAATDRHADLRREPARRQSETPLAGGDLARRRLERCQAAGEALGGRWHAGQDRRGAGRGARGACAGREGTAAPGVESVACR